MVAFLATIVLAGGVEPWHLFVTAGVIGGVQAIAQASRSSIFPRLVEREHIVAILSRTNWVIEGPNGAARILNLHPNTLRSRMKRLGVTRPGR